MANSPEAKAAEAVWQAPRLSAAHIERIIAKANAEYYLPLFREWHQYMPERLTFCGDIAKEIERLEAAGKEGQG